MRIGYVTFDAAGKAGASPVNNPKVRQAIAYAVNRKSIVENLFAGGARVVHSACFPEQFGCDQTIKHYDYNVAKAKELLKEAGYPNGFRSEEHTSEHQSLMRLSYAVFCSKKKHKRTSLNNTDKT